MPINDIMRISVAGLHANLTAMEVISHNVSNMNTHGYSRQTALLTPSLPRNVNGIYLGSGVDVTGVRRAEDRYLNRNVYLGIQDKGANDAASAGLNELQEIFNETGDATGTSSRLSDFWAAWSDLANAPEGSAERVAVQGKARVLVTNFHTLNARLKSLRKNLDLEVSDEVTRVNEIVKKIADLNVNIANIENMGQSANDFRTIRNGLMEDLGQLIDYTYFEDDRGGVVVSVGGGLPLVEQGTYGTLEARNNPMNSSLKDVYFVSQSGIEQNITGTIAGGEMYGNLQVRDRHIQDQLDKLDEIAFTLIDQVNAIHVTGFGLNGSTGNNFFTPLATSSDASAFISLDAAISSDYNNIVGGLIAEPGDNRAANLIAALRDTPVLNGGTDTFQEYYGGMIGTVGIAAENAANSVKQSEAVLNQMEQYRESVIGVSIEEEMANLMRYQEAYQAAARMINAVSEMMAVLENLKS